MKLDYRALVRARLFLIFCASSTGYAQGGEKVTNELTTLVRFVFVRPCKSIDTRLSSEGLHQVHDVVHRLRDFNVVRSYHGCSAVPMSTEVLVSSRTDAGLEDSGAITNQRNSSAMQTATRIGDACGTRAAVTNVHFGTPVNVDMKVVAARLAQAVKKGHSRTVALSLSLVPDLNDVRKVMTDEMCHIAQGIHDADPGGYSSTVVVSCDDEIERLASLNPDTLDLGMDPGEVYMYTVMVRRPVVEIICSEDWPAS